MRGKTNLILHDKKIAKKIFFLRGEKVILDIHIAELYQSETRTLKQSIRRNLKRFPDDFMFELNEEELDYLVSQNVIPSKKHLGGAKPFAFTESGVAMLSSVLKSDKAIEMNIAIIRTFIMLRKASGNFQEIAGKLEALDRKYEGRFEDIYKALNQLIDQPNPKRAPIGFRSKENN